MKDLKQKVDGSKKVVRQPKNKQNRPRSFFFDALYVFGINNKANSNGKTLTASNNVIPRVTPPSASPGLGLQYIRNQYRDLAGKEVQVENVDGKFTVTLPLLED